MIINVIFFETIFTTNAVSFFSFNWDQKFFLWVHTKMNFVKNTCMNEKYGFNKKDENIA